MTDHEANTRFFRTGVSLPHYQFQTNAGIPKKENESTFSLQGSTKKGELQLFCEMTGMLWLTFEEEIDDYLGKIYMEGNMGNKQTGQFFTPFNLAELTARLRIERGKQVFLNEPASGGGAMILAAAKIMKESGDNYQELMKVVAQDLDWNGVYMTYIQLSMAGIVAKVIQGDTLKNETPSPSQILYTPMYLLKGGLK